MFYFSILLVGTWNLWDQTQKRKNETWSYNISRIASHDLTTNVKLLKRWTRDSFKSLIALAHTWRENRQRPQIQQARGAMQPSWLKYKTFSHLHSVQFSSPLASPCLLFLFNFQKSHGNILGREGTFCMGHSPVTSKKSRWLSKYIVTQHKHCDNTSTLIGGYFHSEKLKEEC